MNDKKSVLITGSSRGLGRELALKFAIEDYPVIIHGRDNQSIRQTSEKILSLEKCCFRVDGDLMGSGTIEYLKSISEKLGISVLINNAVIHCPNIPLEQFEDKRVYDMIHTNLIAPILLTKKIFPIFIMQGYGTIININSLSGMENQKLRSVYSASKWGLRGFSNSLKLEAMNHNIKVINVFASRIKTRPEFSYGMEPEYVAGKIYEHWASDQRGDLILDDRPIEFRRGRQ